MAQETQFHIFDSRERRVGGRAVQSLDVELTLSNESRQAFALLVDVPTAIEQMYSWDVSIVTHPHVGPIGRVDVLPWLHPSNVNRAAWVWWLTDLELERLEGERGGNDITLSITGHGLGVQDDAVVPFHGYATVYVPVSTWTGLLQHRPYAPATWLRLPVTSTHWPNWATSLDSLQAAVTALSRGESSDAVAKCFAVFDEIEPHLNREDRWKTLFDVDVQKAEGLAALLSGFLTYVNKIGRHPHRSARNAVGSLVRADVDHYEAELTVAMALLLTAYIERLPWHPHPSRPPGT